MFFDVTLPEKKVWSQKSGLRGSLTRIIQPGDKDNALVCVTSETNLIKVLRQKQTVYQYKQEAP